MELKKARAEYYARWEAVEIVKAHELAAMTGERGLQIIRSLRLFASVEGWDRLRLAPVHPWPGN